VHINQILKITSKNRNWSEEDEIAIFKHSREVELGTTEKQLQLVTRDPVTFRPRSYILKSKSLVRWCSLLLAHQPDLFYQLRILLLSF